MNRETFFELDNETQNSYIQDFLSDTPDFEEDSVVESDLFSDYMGFNNHEFLNEETQIILMKICNIVLSDADIFNHLTESLEIEDKELKKLQEKISNML